VSEPIRAADLVHIEEESSRELVNVLTGERLPATLENAGVVLAAAREMKDRIQGVIREATDVIVEESRRQGTKTFHFPGRVTATVSGGDSISYDPGKLREALEMAGCPEERIDGDREKAIKGVIKTTVTETVDRAVLRQLVAANPDYKAAAELAEVRETKPFSASLKGA
jgi:hypothetical protein